MKDYPVERLLRDSRITTIYEGTSQLQVVAAIGGVMNGTAAEVIQHLLGGREWSAELQPLVAALRAGLGLMAEAVAYVKAHPDSISYRDLHARKLVDLAIDLLVGALFCDHATANEKKLLVARRWVAVKQPRMRALVAEVCSGEASTLNDFEALAIQTSVAD